MKVVSPTYRLSDCAVGADSRPAAAKRRPRWTVEGSPADGRCHPARPVRRPRRGALPPSSARGRPPTTASASGRRAACGTRSWSAAQAGVGRDRLRPVCHRWQRDPVHVAAAGASKKKARPASRRTTLGRSQGGFGTKVHLICDGNGLPLAVTLSPGQEHETQQVHDLLEPLLEAERVPEHLAGDKAYSAGWIGELLAELKIKPVIPHRKNEAGRPSDSARNGSTGGGASSSAASAGSSGSAASPPGTRNWPCTTWGCSRSPSCTDSWANDSPDRA